ncbi:MAG: VF530 family protein [Bacteroidota bacterium]
MTETTIQKNNPLHGIKLEQMLTELVDTYCWEFLADNINVNCFKKDPSIKSSLTFLRKTPWARTQIEGMYLKFIIRAKKKKDSLSKDDEEVGKP